MAELILTQKELDATSWLEVSDDALGKVVRKGMLEIAAVAEQQNRLLAQSAAFVLVGMAVEINADHMELSLGGVTNQDRAVGDWKVTVELDRGAGEAGDGD